jgi:thioredoxin reductase (NADPH)
MPKPIILAVDDDPQVLRAVVRDLRNQYGKDYRILSTTSANEALESLIELKNKNETLALFLSDQRMPEMLGVEFLAKAKVICSQLTQTLRPPFEPLTMCSLTII